MNRCYCRPTAEKLRSGRRYSRLGCRNLGLGGTDGCLSAQKAGPNIIKLLHCNRILFRQDLKAIQSFSQCLQFGLALGEPSRSGLLFAQSLVYLAHGRFDCIMCLLQLGLGLATLRLQVLGIHACQNLTGGHKITFIRQDFLNAAGALGGDIDLNRFDPAVATDQTIFRCFRLHVSPRVESTSGHCDSDDQP